MATVAPFRRNDGGRAVCTQIPYGIAIVSMQMPHPIASHSDFRRRRMQCPLALTDTPARPPAHAMGGRQRVVVYIAARSPHAQCTHAQTTSQDGRGNEFKNHQKIKKSHPTRIWMLTKHIHVPTGINGGCGHLLFLLVFVVVAVESSCCFACSRCRLAAL